jgi:hypothetical protein
MVLNSYVSVEDANSARSARETRVDPLPESSLSFREHLEPYRVRFRKHKLRHRRQSRLVLQPQGQAIGPEHTGALADSARILGPTLPGSPWRAIDAIRLRKTNRAPHCAHQKSASCADVEDSLCDACVREGRRFRCRSQSSASGGHPLVHESLNCAAPARELPGPTQGSPLESQTRRPPDHLVEVKILPERRQFGRARAKRRVAAR